jgi:hypothetical protein
MLSMRARLKVSIRHIFNLSEEENDRIDGINWIDEGLAGKELRLFSGNIPFIL